MISILFALSQSIAAPPIVETENISSNNLDWETPIINGEDATTDDYPMTGGTLIHGIIFDFPIDTLVCSSTLIAPDVVLIAAHCVDMNAISFGLPVDDLQMWWTRQADLTDWDGSQEDPTLPTDAIEATEWIPHEDFNLSNMELGLAENFDIALIFLSEPVLDISPAYLPTAAEDDSMTEGDWVAVVGWGQQVATNQQEAPPAGTYAVKQQGESFIAEIAPFEFKVGESQTDVRKCHGDSGGPSFWESSDGMRLVGVTSHAYDTTDCNETGGVDTRVQYFRSWIDAKMIDGCNRGVRVWCDETGILPPNYFEELEAEEEEDKGLFGCATSTSRLDDSLYLLLLSLILVRRKRS